MNTLSSVVSAIVTETCQYSEEGEHDDLASQLGCYESGLNFREISPLASRLMKIMISGTPWETT